MKRNPRVDWGALDDVYYGSANQAGEDNRNVARMALLLSGLPDVVPGATINHLCDSGLDAAGVGARAIRSGEAELVIAAKLKGIVRPDGTVTAGNASGVNDGSCALLNASTEPPLRPRGGQSARTTLEKNKASRRAARTRR